MQRGIKKSDIKQLFIDKNINDLKNAVSVGDKRGAEQVLQRICNVVVLKDDLIDNDFINAIKQNKLDTFGSWEIRAAGRAYYLDFIPEKVKTKTVKTSCGRRIEIKYVICNEPFDSQVVNEYSDVIDVNVNKTLPITIPDESLRRIACGPNAYSDLKNLIQSKVVEATINLVYNEVLCRLNDPMTYATVKEIPYCCDKCDGQNFISAIEEFALTLQRNTSAYNLSGRDYDLPIKSMWLIKSFRLNSRIKNIMARALNNDYVNINQNFGNNWALDIKNYDGIILDKQAIQVHEIFNEIFWTYTPNKRAQCGVSNYELRIKIINPFVAVPFRLIKVDCADKQTADNLTYKIESITKTYQVSDQADAETQIKADIDALKPEGTELTYKYTFSNYTASTAEENGYIDVSVDILNKSGTVLSTANNTIKLAPKTPVDISTVVTVLDIGQFTGTPNTQQLEDAVFSVNSKYVKGNATYSDITTTSATMTGTGLYTGTRSLTYKQA